MGILAALHALPLTTPFTILSDSKASILTSDTSQPRTTNKRLKLGARPIMVSITRALNARKRLGTPYHMQHVRAHTGKDDFFSRGNALADEHAGSAAQNKAYKPQQSAPFLVNEERLVGWVQLNPGAKFTHIIGNFRKTVEKQLIRSLLAPLAHHRTQGKITVQHSAQVLSIFRSLRKSGDAPLHLFFLRAVATRLPTPTTLRHGTACATPLPDLRCALCSRTEATSSHALACPALAPFIRSLMELIPPLVHSIIHPLLDAPNVSTATKRFLRSLPSRLEWYNPLNAPSSPASASRQWDDAPPSMRNLLLTLDRTPRYPSMLGILPTSLKQLLSPPVETLGFPEGTLRDLRKSNTLAWDTLRMTLLRNSRRIFTHWQRLTKCKYLLSHSHCPNPANTAGFAH